METDRGRLEDFLAGIDLLCYRNRHKDIKIVELDMPKNVQALVAMCCHYWDNRSGNYPGFDEFYHDCYLAPLRDDLEVFRKKAQFSEETFYRGLPARIYRTWASMLTQTQGAYVAEEIYGKGNVSMSVSQDHRGRDMIINIPNIGQCGLQTKKVTGRKEARRVERVAGTKAQPINVVYEIPASGPLTPTGKPSKAYRKWESEWGHLLNRLENGFVVFRPPMFQPENLLNCIIKD